MRDIELVKEAFSNCMVINGKIQFFKKFTPEQIKKIYFTFTEDLLNCNIPHWRVIGFYHEWGDSVDKSVFKHNTCFDKSLIELSISMKYLIPSCNGGNDPSAGCFYGENENVSNYESFDQAYGWSPSMSAKTRKANILKLSKEEIGSLMITTSYGDDNISIDKLTTDNPWYTQFSVVSQFKYPKMLIKGKELCNINFNENSNGRMFMFIKEGTGRLRYSETQKFFNEEWEYLMPCDVAYDLSEFFSCALPKDETDSLRLVYRANINEDVLTTILQNYGRRLS